jgi:hypothetical protein
MSIIGIIVTCIKVTTYALQIQFFLIFFVIKMGGDSLVGYPFRKKILVALFT